MSGTPLPEPTALRGRTAPWGRAGAALLVVLVLFAAWLRLRGLSAEGFADDEVHKWLAARRYLAGSFGGDDVEHPMLMKSLVALAIATFHERLAPEALTRLPNALAGALTVWAVALLGRRLFGRGAALVGAGLLAVSTTAVGYQRIGKEDVLLGLFFTLSVWCLAEARAAAQDDEEEGTRGGLVLPGDRAAGSRARRWERWSAVALGAAFASKYFVFYFLIPVLAYLWLRPVSAWRVPLRRWAALIGIALLVFVALDWAPFLPGSADYLVRYIRGDVVGTDRGVSESIVFMGKLYGNLALRGDATPPWFFGAFAMAKFLPATAILALAGLVVALVRRAPSHRVVLPWLLIFWLFSVVAGAKYGRFFVSVMPPFLLLAGHGAAAACRWIAARLRSAGPAQARLAAAVTAAAGIAIIVPEAANAVAHAPHERLYVNAFAGGDARVGWFLPHCDYFDAGVREAIRWIAARAEPSADVCSEVDWTVRLYAGEAGRADLVSRPFLPQRCCPGGAPCWIIVQAGRLYRHNQDAVAHLAARRPDHVERIRGTDAVRVYRLGPGEDPFATAAVPASASAR